MATDKLTELNIQLNTKHRRYKALVDERKKIHDALQEDDQKKMGITRNLEKQLVEKEEKIKEYETRLAELEATSGAISKNMETKFQGEIDEMTRKHDNLMNQKESEMQGLEGQLGNLHEFKDTKQQREENLAREMNRFKRLRKELENLK